MKKITKALHILSACLWLGASWSVMLLQCLRGWSEDARALANLNVDLALLEATLIIPGAAGSLLTGFFLCKTTSWRFMRYRWVIAKWIGAMSGILLGSILLGPWQIQMVNLSGELGHASTTGSQYSLIRLLFTIVGFLQVYLLITMIAVSLLKPWGKRIARREAERTAGAHGRQRVLTAPQPETGSRAPAS
jgi:hypothetical protein